MLGLQLVEHHEHRVEIELVGGDHRVLVLVHHAGRDAPQLLSSSEALDRVACERPGDQRHPVQPRDRLVSPDHRIRYVPGPDGHMRGVGACLADGRGRLEHVLLVGVDDRPLHRFARLHLGERQLFRVPYAHEELHVGEKIS